MSGLFDEFPASLSLIFGASDESFQFFSQIFKLYITFKSKIPSNTMIVIIKLINPFFVKLYLMSRKLPEWIYAIIG